MILWGMKNENVPCYGCAERSLGCHGTCDRYKEFQKQREDVRREKMALVERNEIVGDSFNRALRRARK